MNDYKWTVLSKFKKVKIEDVVKTILGNRGIKTTNQYEQFLKPKHPDELTLKELKIDNHQAKKAVERVKQAIGEGEKIIVYGDYDADGVCATATLWETLWSAKADVLPYLPDRFTEGYGLNEKAIQSLKDKYVNLGLLITVDNGIVARDEVVFAKRLGIDTIITDHHEKGESYPSEACAVLHTKCLSGAGISWVFSREVLGGSLPLDLAAIGTVADQIPLIGPARSFAYYGIRDLRVTTRCAIKAICEVAGVDQGTIDTYKINYVLAPRINASGRMEHAMDSLRLVCVKDMTKARVLAGHVNEININRQNAVYTALEQAKSSTLDKGSVVVSSSESYNEGIIGLVASRLVEMYYRPAIVFSINKDVAKASARSIPGLNIIDLIRSQSRYLIDGGGHEMAAGFSIKTSHLAQFIKNINKVAAKKLTPEILLRKLNIDLELPLDAVNHALAARIHELEPFGIGNPVPLFLTRRVSVTQARIVGKEGKHLKLNLTKDGINLPAIAFGMGEATHGISPGQLIDIVYSLEENTWNGVSELQLKIRDLRI